MLVVRKFNLIYSNRASAFPFPFSPPPPCPPRPPPPLPHTWSSLIKSANPLHRNLGGSALIFSLIPYSLPLTSTCFHRSLHLSPKLCLSLALFPSFSAVCLSKMLFFFLLFSQTHSNIFLTFLAVWFFFFLLRLSFWVSIIIFLHLAPL